MASKITGIQIQDFKRIRLVDIQPNETGLTILGDTAATVIIEDGRIQNPENK